jgi:hypothetical protein
MTFIWKSAAIVAAAFALLSLVAEGQGNSASNREQIPGIYFGLTEILTFSGSFGTVTCEQANPGDFEACQFYSALHLRPDGTATTTISKESDLSEPQIVWKKTGPRTIDIRSFAIQYDGDGNAQNWSVADGIIQFEKGFKTYDFEVTIKRYPITEDPSNPTAPPVLVIETVATGTLLE